MPEKGGGGRYILYIYIPHVLIALDFALGLCKVKILDSLERMCYFGFVKIIRLTRFLLWYNWIKAVAVKEPLSCDKQRSENLRIRLLSSVGRANGC